jgi:hypothetical protein
VPTLVEGAIATVASTGVVIAAGAGMGLDTSVCCEVDSASASSVGGGMAVGAGRPGGRLSGIGDCRGERRSAVVGEVGVGGSIPMGGAAEEVGLRVAWVGCDIGCGSGSVCSDADCGGVLVGAGALVGAGVIVGTGVIVGAGGGVACGSGFTCVGGGGGAV